MVAPYQLKHRAERQDETRQRIVEATIELHQTIGPAATTVSDIAERAQVGRVTVYRHFPDEPTLARACSGLYFERHPFPDPEPLEGDRGPRRAAAHGAARDIRLPPRDRGDDDPRARRRPRPSGGRAVPRALAARGRRPRRAVAGTRPAPHAAARRRSGSRSASTPGARSRASSASPTTRRSS